MSDHIDSNDSGVVMRFPRPVLGFSSLPGTGKKALVVQLLACFRARGLEVVLIKQSHDHTDSAGVVSDDEYRRAGASRVLLMAEDILETEMNTIWQGNVADRPADAHVLENADLILLDGFERLPVARIELYRHALNNKLRFPHDSSVIAVAADEYLETGSLPLLNINLPEEVAGYINRWLRSQSNAAVSGADMQFS